MKIYREFFPPVANSSDNYNLSRDANVLTCLYLINNYAFRGGHSVRPEFFIYAVTIFAASCKLRKLIASSRILYFSIFPAAFIGNAATNRT